MVSGEGGAKTRSLPLGDVKEAGVCGGLASNVPEQPARVRTAKMETPVRRPDREESRIVFSVDRTRVM
jgi:hypothetical protein